MSGIEDLLARFLAQDPETNDAMRRRAKVCFDTRFDLLRSAGHLLEMLRGLIEGGGGKSVAAHGNRGRGHYL
jgi:hypothetical protein